MVKVKKLPIIFFALILTIVFQLIINTKIVIAQDPVCTIDSGLYPTCEGSDKSTACTEIMIGCSNVGGWYPSYHEKRTCIYDTGGCPSSSPWYCTTTNYCGCIGCTSEPLPPPTSTTTTSSTTTSSTTSTSTSSTTTISTTTTTTLPACGSSCTSQGYDDSTCPPEPTSGSCVGTTCRYNVNNLGLGYDPCDPNDCICYDTEPCGSTQSECDSWCDPSLGCQPETTTTLPGGPGSCANACDNYCSPQCVVDASCVSCVGCNLGEWAAGSCPDTYCNPLGCCCECGPCVTTTTTIGTTTTTTPGTTTTVTGTTTTISGTTTTTPGTTTTVTGTTTTMLPTCGNGVVEGTEQCELNTHCPYCYQQCAPPGSPNECECYDFRSDITGTCQYYDYCEGGYIPGTSNPCPDCGDPGLNPGDICDNDYCSNVEESLCRDGTAICNEKITC